MSITALTFLLFCAVISIQCMYYLYFFTGVFKRIKLNKKDTTPVSVVMCARNNRAGLESNLPRILSQKYPNFEVIVVNDGSTDGTLDFLDNLAKEVENLRVLHLDIDERFHRGKKFAQTIGIKAAKYDKLLFTDTDCYPDSEYWIENMTADLHGDTEIVLGVSNYERRARPLNWLIQLETFHSAMLYINFALKKHAYMGLGRNLAYSRALFFKVKGFASHQHILSGDDDLFVNETATETNVTVSLQKEGRTYSIPATHFGQWFRQKKRHFSTGRFYKLGDKFRLGIYFLSLFLTYLMLVPLLLNPQWMFVALAIFGVRFLIQMIVLFKNMSILDYKTYFFLFPFMDLGIIFVQVFVGIRGYFSKPQAW